MSRLKRMILIMWRGIIQAFVKHKGTAESSTKPPYQMYIQLLISGHFVSFVYLKFIKDQEHQTRGYSERRVWTTSFCFLLFAFALISQFDSFHVPIRIVNDP